VGYFRNNLFIPFVNVTDISSINQELLTKCDLDNKKLHYRYRISQIELFEQEKEVMQKFNPIAFDTAKYERRRVNKYGHITFNKSSYSSSPYYVNEYVWIKIMANEIIILTDDYQELTRHKRSFETGKTYTHWIDFIDLITTRPKALKYTSFYKTLPDSWVSYTETLGKDDLKKALSFLKHCLVKENLSFADLVLQENIKQEVFSPDALWTTYYRLKEDVTPYRSGREIAYPAMPTYAVALSEYDSLIGGDYS